MAIYNWKNYALIPKNGLETWHQYEAGVSANNLIKDYSGHSRDVSCSSSGAPVQTLNVLNGQPGWYFSGTSNPLVFTGTLGAIRHVFVVMSFDDAAFTQYQGVLSGITAGDILTSDTAGTNFFNFGYTPGAAYYKDDVSYPLSGMKAPVSGKFAVIELQVPGTGSGIIDLSIGQQGTHTDRKLKGYFFEALTYSVILNDLSRFRLLNYFAMRYQLWQRQTDAGLYVFPFASNKTVAAERDIENFVSEPYSGSLKALTRGSFKSAFSSQYLLREQAEHEAAEAFHEQHRPVKDFVFRDWRYNPPKDTTCRFTSSIKNQGSDTTYRFNYQFDHLQTA